jgi:hypothetical protein
MLPLVLVVLVTSGGIGWALALTKDRDRPPGSTSGTAQSADSTAAFSTMVTVAPTATVVPTRPTGTTVAPSRATGTTVAPRRTTGTTTQPRSPSLLQRPMARPDGVAAVMDVGFGAGDEDHCRAASSQVQKPTIYLGFGSPSSVAAVQIAEPLPICLLRFNAGAPIQVTIRSPAGRLERITAPTPTCDAAACTSLTAWAALPGDPLGRYDMTASQGDISLQGRITVRAADGPRLMVIGSAGDELATRVTVRPGTTIGIALAGLRPRRSMDLLFFYTPSFRWGGELVAHMQFRASTTVPIDPGGGTIFWLRTSPTDPLGCYLVNTWPPHGALVSGLSPPYPQDVWTFGASSHQFCLKR